MMKQFVLVSLSVSLLASLPACSSDGEKEDCVGLNCPTGEQWPDAGEVRVWAIRLPDGSLVRRYFGFFYDPAGTSKTETIIPSPIGKGLCGPEETFGWQPQERAYLDVGDHITFEMSSGENIEVGRLMPNPDNEDCMVPGVPCVAGIPDWFGRMHDIAYILETLTPPDQLDDENVYNSFHAVVAAEPIPGNPDGERIDGLFLGPAFGVNEPVRPDGQTVTMTKGQALHFQYDFEQAVSAPLLMASAIVIATPTVPGGGNGGHPLACLEVPTGQQDIPSDAIDSLPANSGFMLVGNGTDQAQLFGDRIFHKWGIFCNFFPWQRVE